MFDFFTMKSCSAATRLSAVAITNFVGFSILLAAAPLGAANYNWVVPSGDWSVASNWSGTVVPTASDFVNIVNSGTANITQFGETCGSLSVGGGGSGTVQMSAGSLSVAFGESVGLSGLGTFTQTGGTNSCSNGIYIGYVSSGNGTYNLNGGMLSTTAVVKGLGTAVFNFSGGTLQASSGFTTTQPMILGTSGGGATFDTGLNAVTLSGSISGPGSLTKVDFGLLTLATTNTFSGNTLITGGGTLVVGSSLALQQSTLDTSGNGFLSFGSPTSAVFGGLTGPGTLGLANTSASAVALSVGKNNGSTTFSGMLKGAGSLTKVGSGTLLLTATSTYLGPTTINQGKLTVDGWLTNSAVSVTGGTLGGTGHLASVTVNAGGSLAPGDSLGTLNVAGNLILASSSVLDFGLDTPSTSSMVSCGGLALNGQQFTDFNFTPTGNFVPGIYDLIVAGSNPTGTLGSITGGTIDGYSATLAVQNNDLVLTVVPEPSALALLGAGVLGLIGWAWRRRLRVQGLLA